MSSVKVRRFASAIVGAIVSSTIGMAHAQTVQSAQFALIATNPYAVIATYPQMPKSVALPGANKVFGAAVGWSSDGYALVDVTPFVAPPGYVTIGAPSYSIDGNGNVSENYSTVLVSPTQQAEAVLAVGLALTSTSAPALNGIYPLDPKTQQKIVALAHYVSVNGAFPNGRSALAVPDQSGALHRFTSAVTFMAFAKAVADYVDVVDETAAVFTAGGSAAWPVASATIP